MKSRILVDILARGLTAWPEGLECLSQQKGSGYIINGKGFDGRAFDSLPIADETRIAGAIVTRAEWQAAVDALKAEHSEIPALGEYWPGQGGHNGGTVAATDEVPAHYLIIAAKDVGSHEWGERVSESQATSKRDGFANTITLMEGDHPAAKAATGYTADGHDNFYLPAAAELYHCWLSAPDLFAKYTWYWSSTQRSAYDAFSMYFDDGYQDISGKLNELRVRPVRRLFIDSLSNSDGDDSADINAGKVVEWDGAGLPPVGSDALLAKECKFTDGTRLDSFPAGTVVYVGGHANFGGCDLAVIIIKGRHFCGTVIPELLKPIRTPEQIAAEERMAAAYAMCAIAPSLSNVEAADLYNAGYRKQVEQ